MAKCDVCGKRPQFGHNVSHSHHKTNRSWALNVKRTTVVLNGKVQRVTVCTRCLRTMNRVST